MHIKTYREDLRMFQQKRDIIKCSCRNQNDKKMLDYISYWNSKHQPTFTTGLRCSGETVLFSAKCLFESSSLIFQVLLDCHTIIMNTCIYDAFGRAVCSVCVCVCLHDNLKTNADICFLLGSYTEGEMSRSQVKVFSEGSRSLGKVMSNAVVGVRFHPRWLYFLVQEVTYTNRQTFKCDAVYGSITCRISIASLFTFLPTSPRWKTNEWGHFLYSSSCASGFSPFLAFFADFPCF